MRSSFFAGLTRRADYLMNRAAVGVSVHTSPGSALPLLAPTHGAPRSVLLLFAAGRGSAQARPLGADGGNGDRKPFAALVGRGTRFDTALSARYFSSTAVTVCSKLAVPNHSPRFMESLTW